MSIETIKDEDGLPISVVVPLSPNREGFFDDFCLPSIETNDPYEIIVVNDKKGSAPYKRNKGAEQATQEYIFFCDDDIILPGDLFSNEMQLIQNGGEDIAYAYTGYKGIVFENTNHPIKKNFVNGSMPFNGEKLKQFNFISTMSLLKRDYFFGFDENLNRFQDWDLWLNLYLNHNKKGVFWDKEQFLAFFFDDGISNNKNSERDAIMKIKEKYNIYG